MTICSIQLAGRYSVNASVHRLFNVNHILNIFLVVVCSIQFYGECWSGVKAPLTYDRYGPSSECVSNVGGRWSNLVYRFIGDGQCSNCACP